MPYLQEDGAMSYAAAPGRSPGGPTLTVQAGTGSRFGSPSPTNKMRIQTGPPGAAYASVYLVCTGRSGDVLTVEVQEGKTDGPTAEGDVVVNGWIKADIEDLGPQAVVAVTYGSTSTIDWEEPNQRLVLLGNTTIAFSNPTEGQSLNLIVAQDGTGGRTVTWPSGITWLGTGGTVPPLASAPNAVNSITLFRHSSGYYGWFGGDSTTSQNFVTAGDFADAVDGLEASIADKQDALPLGSASQYLRGDLSLATLDTDALSDFPDPADLNGGVVTSTGTGWTLTTPSGGGGSGTVTSTSVVSANGFAGSVATPTTTPAITITTSVTGMLKGDGTAVSAAVANTDYVTPSAISGLASTSYVDSAIATREPSLPGGGTTGQYLRGDKSWQSFSASVIAALPTQSGNNGKFLSTDGANLSFVAIDLSTYATTTALSSGLSGKEPTIAAGTTSQYWRGDKSWQTLATDVIAALPSQSGNSGKYLSTNGSALSWATVAGGSMAIGSAVTSGTSGSVLFVDSSSNLAQDNSNFSYSSSTKVLTMGSTGSIKTPKVELFNGANAGPALTSVYQFNIDYFVCQAQTGTTTGVCAQFLPKGSPSSNAYAFQFYLRADKVGYFLIAGRPDVREHVLAVDNASVSGGNYKLTVRNGTTTWNNNPVLWSWPDTGEAATCTPRSASDVGLVVKGLASQTGDLLQAQSNGGTVLMGVDAKGGLKLTAMANSAANNSTLYFSTDLSKPAWKDSSGTVTALF